MYINLRAIRQWMFTYRSTSVIVKYCFFLSPIYAVICVYLITHGYTVGGSIGLGLSLLIMYMYFIERYWVRTRYISLDKGWGIRIAVVSDIHLGVFKSPRFLDQVVTSVMQIPNITAVLYPGDFVYRPLQVAGMFDRLADIDHPSYAVMGNHDYDDGHPCGADDIAQQLQSLGITVCDNQIHVLTQEVSMYALGDCDHSNDDVSILENVSDTDKIVIMTHNPDTMEKYPNIDLANTVTITGHTHHGQIRIPWLFKYFLPTAGMFTTKDAYDMGGRGALVISGGLGETSLPLRLFNRPEIIVLDL